MVLFLMSYYKRSQVDIYIGQFPYYSSIFPIKVSFLCTEMAALLCVIVYMAKRDERTYNAYRMRSMLRNIRTDCEKSSDGRNSPFERHLLDNERYHRHTRMNTLRRYILGGGKRNISLIGLLLLVISPQEINQFRKAICPSKALKVL
jgi:hypothetical protein